jgi:hypothetical protein
VLVAWSTAIETGPLPTGTDGVVLTHPEAWSRLHVEALSTATMPSVLSSGSLSTYNVWVAWRTSLVTEQARTESLG